MILDCKLLPGLSDHDMILTDIQIRVGHLRRNIREVWCWKKADVKKLHSAAKSFSGKFIETHNNSLPVEMMWTTVKDEINVLMEDNIPKKTAF